MISLLGIKKKVFIFAAQKILTAILVIRIFFISLKQFK